LQGQLRKEGVTRQKRVRLEKGQERNGKNMFNYKKFIREGGEGKRGFWLKENMPRGKKGIREKSISFSLTRGNCRKGGEDQAMALF